MKAKMLTSQANELRQKQPKVELTQTTNPASDPLPPTLTAAIQDVYQPAGLKVTIAPWREAESAEYSACRVGLNGYTVAFRVAKTTPTKTGQFVTLWKRPTSTSEIAPLDTSDDVDFVVISVSDATHSGQFVFDQNLLVTQGVISTNGEGGKRALRIYPPWTKPVAKAAIKTQHWQLQCFLPLAANGTAESGHVRQLFKIC